MTMTTMTTLKAAILIAVIAAIMLAECTASSIPIVQRQTQTIISEESSEAEPATDDVELVTTIDDTTDWSVSSVKDTKAAKFFKSDTKSSKKAKSAKASQISRPVEHEESGEAQISRPEHEESSEAQISRLEHEESGEAESSEAEPRCSTPELSNLATLTSDLRSAYQNANLPTISSQCETNLSKKKVLMIGIDSLRVDVVGVTPLPNIKRLQDMGTYSLWANIQTTGAPLSGPGWSSMFTGVEPSRHLVDGDDDLQDLAYPTVFKSVKDTFGMKIAASVRWDPLLNDIINHEDENTLETSFLALTDNDIAAKAEEWISSEEYDFVFVNFDDPILSGNSAGFVGYPTVYRNKVRATDVLVGKLLDAVLDTSSGEEWLIVLSSDHGGEGSDHGGSDAYPRKIPLLVASNSPRVNVGTVPFDDPGSQMDVLPTIMHFLGGPSAIPSGLDGQVFGFNDFTRKPPPPPPTCDPDNCGCESAQQADYRGTISTTQSGKTCQAWDSQSPHGHIRTEENYPNAGLESNYCRNPDGEPVAWCYTTDREKRWEFCSVPTCV